MIKCLNNNKVYTSLNEIKEDLDINTSNINKVCTGKLKSVGGYRFEYVDTNTNLTTKKLVGTNTNLPTKKLVGTNNSDTNTNSDTKKLVGTNTDSDWKKIPQVIEYRQKALAKMQEQKNRIEELEAELARLRATTPQPQQENDGWDEYERELEAKEKNPVMENKEKPQPKPPIIEKPTPKNPYLQDEEEDCWDFIDDDDEEQPAVKSDLSEEDKAWEEDFKNHPQWECGIKHK